MNNLIIEIPSINDQEKINKLAVQVQDLHVKWRNNLFIKQWYDVKRKVRGFNQAKRILVARLNNKMIRRRNNE